MSRSVWRYFILAAIFLPANILQGQVSRDDFNIIFENNFNDDQSGTYQTPDFANDWNITNGGGPVGNIEILNDDASHQKMMRAYYPTGTMLATDEHGFTWYSYLASKQEEMYFSYDVRFKPGFEWVHGGKIPGIVGGSVTSGQAPTSTTGFSVRPCWKGGGNLVFYVYHHDQVGVYGDIFYFEGFKFETGKWYNLTMRVVLNSVVNGTAVANGVLEGYIDGKLIFQKTGFRYRLNDGIKIEKMYICSFFGGNTPEWATLRDEWMDTDNFVAFTYSNNATGVPRGFQLSSFDKVLLHPINSFSGTTPGNTTIPSDPSGLGYSILDKSNVTLNWTDNSTNESGFKVYRSTSETSGFIEAGSLPANTISFTDNSLQPGTTYYYKLLAFNQYGNSSYTPVFQLTTPLLNLPSPPWDLGSNSQTNTTISLNWKENSTREEGFKLYRSRSENDGFVEVASCPANTTTCLDESLQPGTTYFYKVRAHNSDGYSEYCEVFGVATKTTGDPGQVFLNTVFIDPENINDPEANGSMNHPYNSWSDLTWTEGYAYLQKRGTTASVDMIQVNANHITIGAYGEGNVPVISSQTTNHLISGFEKSGIHIQDVALQANKAVSCIYFLGSASDSIVVERTLLTASSNAIKVVDVTTLVAKYNRISSENEGIFSTAENNSIYYNIFEACQTGVNILGNSARAEIYNNVFADNMRSIAVSYAALTLYNNIFYFSNSGQVALNQGTGKFISDNNIYFPEQEGFITIAGKKYNNLDEIQKELKTDLKSFTSNPLFIDIANSNYRLNSKSPAVNSGKNTLQNTDFEGNKVPVFKSVDIGAFEFNGDLIIDQQQSEENAIIKVYPNPSAGPVTIEAQLKEEFVSDEPYIAFQELKVLDLTGKIILSRKININGTESHEERIDLSGFSNGLYFVVLKIAGETFNQKLLIIK